MRRKGVLRKVTVVKEERREGAREGERERGILR